MVVLAKLWTFTGEIYIPIALAWGVFVRGGTPGDFKEGVLITWGFYTRRGGMLCDIERRRALPPAAPQPAE